MFKRIPDNFLSGMLIGGLLLIAIAVLISYLRGMVYAEQDIPIYLRRPKPELVGLAVNIFLFRLFMVRLNKEKTGRGILFTTVLLVLMYYFILHTNS